MMWAEYGFDVFSEYSRNPYRCIYRWYGFPIFDVLICSKADICFSGDFFLGEILFIPFFSEYIFFHMHHLSYIVYHICEK